MSDKEILFWKKACLSKYKYRTPEYAEKVAKEKVAKHNKTTNVYKCKYCPGWHLTTRKVNGTK